MGGIEGRQLVVARQTSGGACACGTVRQGDGVDEFTGSGHVGVAGCGVAVAQDLRTHPGGDAHLIPTEGSGAVISLAGAEADCPRRDGHRRIGGIEGR